MAAAAFAILLNFADSPQLSDSTALHTSLDGAVAISLALMVFAVLDSAT